MPTDGEPFPEKGPRKGPKTWASKRQENKRTHITLSVYMSEAELVAFQRIVEYWGSSKAEAFRTMIRYFDANLGLNKNPNTVGVTRKESDAQQ